MPTNYVSRLCLSPLVVLSLTALSFLDFTSATQSSTLDIIVDTTSDVGDFGGAQQVGDLPGPDGRVSLREAITAANNTAGPQVIAFNIPVRDAGFSGTVFTIKPQPTGLPPLFDNGTTIDGATQATFSGETNPIGPEIVLDGSQAGPSPGINIGNSSGHTIRGLVVHSFQQAGIQFIEFPNQPGSPDNNRIVGCYIGTDETGTAAQGNGWQGIATNGHGNIIGGSDPADRNLISGNGTVIRIAEVQVSGFDAPGNGTLVEGNFIGTDRTGTTALGDINGLFVVRATNSLIKGNLISGNASGVFLVGPEAVANRVEDNLIGTDAAGTAPLGNQQSGVSVGNGATGNLITGNTIAFNLQQGVTVGRVTGSATISRNSIFSNGDLGIDLGAGGVNPNDPGDGDIGPNNLMNFPVLTSAHAAPGQLVIKGAIDTPNPQTVTLEFFANAVPTPGGDPSGHGEGAVYLGAVKANPHGKFTAALPAVPVGTLITATATDADGNTSEFAANIVASFP